MPNIQDVHESQGSENAADTAQEGISSSISEGEESVAIPVSPTGIDEETTGECATSVESPSDDKLLQALQELRSDVVRLLQQELSAVKKQLEILQTKTQELESSAKFTSDFVQKTEDERVKTLYAENEKYKAGLLKRLEDELLANVIRQIDEAEKIVRRIENKSLTEITAEEVLASTREIIGDFKDMLQDRYGLTQYTSTSGTTADEQHRITPRKEITADGDLNGKIAKSVTCGYKDREGKVFRQESVVLYEYGPSATAQPETDKESNAETSTL